MYFALYGMRILGIFPNQGDALNYIIEIRNSNKYKHHEALHVEFFNVHRMETLSDLEELD